MGLLGNVYGNINSSTGAATKSSGNLSIKADKETSKNTKSEVDITQFDNLPSKGTQKPLADSNSNFADMNKQAAKNNDKINAAGDPKDQADSLDLKSAITDKNKDFDKVGKEKNPVADTVETVHPEDPGQPFTYKKNKEEPVEDPNKSEAMDWLMEQMLESATGSDPDTPDGKAPDAVNRDIEMPGVKPQKDSNPANNDRPKLQKAKPPTEIKTPPARKNPAMNPTSFTKKPMGAMANIPKPNIPKFKF
jgi:hypothetical protein